MREIETDYLVVGAGATGMAFVDALVGRTDADIVLVDRRHRPGGHWLDAYPFVRLHQPSATYGVDSRRLGDDRIDEHGPNRGFYERASAAEICDYFGRVLDEHLLPSGQVRFLGTTDYRGGDGDTHQLVSRLTGEQITVKVRRRLVDATYVESDIPSRHTPSFSVEPGVRMIPPNDLVDLAEPASGFTVIGAGKTAMDSCIWLIDAGVDPGAIQWIRSRDPWMMNRARMQPLDLVAGYMTLQACWVEAAAEAEDATDFQHRLEAGGVLARIDAHIEPGAFRGANISPLELDVLRSLDNLVHGVKVRAIGAQRITTTNGDIPTEPGRVHVDCTAAGVRATTPRPVFEPGRITLQYVTVGNATASAATIGMVEVLADDDGERNQLCPPVVFTGDAARTLELAQAGMLGMVARAAHPQVNAWYEGSRLNTAGASSTHRDDPEVSDALVRIISNIGAALENLDRRLRPVPAPAISRTGGYAGWTGAISTTSWSTSGPTSHSAA